MVRFFLILFLTLSSLSANALSDNWILMYGDEGFGSFYNPSTKFIDEYGRPSMWFKSTTDESPNYIKSQNTLYTADCKFRKIAVKSVVYLGKHDLEIFRFDIPNENLNLITVDPDGFLEDAYNRICN